MGAITSVTGPLRFHKHVLPDHVQLAVGVPGRCMTGACMSTAGRALSRTWRSRRGTRCRPLGCLRGTCTSWATTVTTATTRTCGARCLLRTLLGARSSTTGRRSTLGRCRTTPTFSRWRRCRPRLHWSVDGCKPLSLGVGDYPHYRARNAAHVRAFWHMLVGTPGVGHCVVVKGWSCMRMAVLVWPTQVVNCQDVLAP